MNRVKKTTFAVLGIAAAVVGVSMPRMRPAPAVTTEELGKKYRAEVAYVDSLPLTKEERTRRLTDIERRAGEEIAALRLKKQRP